VSQASAALRRERNRRLVPRLYLRLTVALALLASAAALLLDRPVPILAGVDPGLSAGYAVLLGPLHALVGGALLVPASRRFAAAGSGLLLIGWMAFMGATARTLPAVATGILLALALSTAAPEDEGPWRLRDRSWLADAFQASRLGALGLLAHWLLGAGLASALPVVGAVLHRRALSRLGGAPPAGHLLLLWGVLFWVGAGAAWGVLGVAPAAPIALPVGWPSAGRPGVLLASLHGAFAVAGLLAFRGGLRLRVGLALSAALFLLGLWWNAPGPSRPACLVLPLALAAVAGMALRSAR